MTIAAAALNPLRRAVVIGALGVVFGDIGTSPIYTFHECLKSSGNAGKRPEGSAKASRTAGHRMRVMCSFDRKQKMA